MVLPFGHFSKVPKVALTLGVEARCLEGTAREFGSTLGISRFNAQDVSLIVSNTQTGEQAEVKLPAER